MLPFNTPGTSARLSQNKRRSTETIDVRIIQFALARSPIAIWLRPIFPAIGGAIFERINVQLRAGPLCFGRWNGGFRFALGRDGHRRT